MVERGGAPFLQISGVPDYLVVAGEKYIQDNFCLDIREIYLKEEFHRTAADEVELSQINISIAIKTFETITKANRK